MDNDHDVLIVLNTKMDVVDEKLGKMDKKLDGILTDVNEKEIQCSKKFITWTNFIGVMTLCVAIVAVVIVF